ncbi:MAG TPA: hypothetical protein PLJ39_08215 [Spirochaetota bacterium]|nr:hypothetical protein [Spirochaetota bacterium]
MANDWKKYYDEGLAYMNSLKKHIDAGKNFSPELKYNICTMGMEKFFISILIYYEMIPFHHTLNALAQDVMEFHDMEPRLVDNLNKIDSFQDMCSLEIPKPRVFTKEEIELTEKTFEEIYNLAKLILYGKNGEDGDSKKESAVS